MKAMKLFLTVSVAVVVSMLLLFAVERRIAQASSSVPQAAGAGEKVVLIDSEQFSDPKTGIARIVNALIVLENEFKPRRTEIQQMSQRYETLLKEIDNTKNVADPKALAAKASEAEALKVNIERKQQDGQADLDRRLKNLTDPIYEDINTALTAFAKQRNVNIILDASKLRGAMLVVNEQVDITKAFIAEYNSKNPLPAAAPATTPAAPKP